ncbi:hypothetical protein WKV53_02455 [Luteolibacter sp. Y139]|uniref:GlsB/YeaQ/YmgE family stress response membrane protein n=1 Tax=Luteolibacter soli TaxID=3135280 RepID=A0ABU9AP93_9BACT
MFFGFIVGGLGLFILMAVFRRGEFAGRILNSALGALFCSFLSGLIGYWMGLSK